MASDVADIAVLKQRLDHHDREIDSMKCLQRRQQESIDKIARVMERQASDNRRLGRHRTELDKIHDTLATLADRIGTNDYARSWIERMAVPFATALGGGLIAWGAFTSL